MIYMVIGIAVILSLYFIFTREKKPVAETPIVSVMPASQAKCTKILVNM